MESDKLLSIIEESRKKMNEFAKGRSLTDPMVVKLSQGLDKLLNMYYAAPRKQSAK